MGHEPFCIEDDINAWVPHGRFTIRGMPNGVLSGLSFAAKDLFDVAGYPTGAGNPEWLNTHPIPTASSPVIEVLLSSGATLMGKTLTDELAYSIHGDNVHYGMPLNSAAPDRIPGGSSSGSAAAVSARYVDFALGTDTGGSTRVPASYCGLWGLRTTHGLIARNGLVPLFPSFDTVNWLAHDADTFVRVAEVLLPELIYMPSELLVLDDAFREAAPCFQVLLERVAVAAHQTFGWEIRHCNIAENESLELWRLTYATAGAYEGWETHGEWITNNTPRFSEDIAARWEMAKKTTPGAAKFARTSREQVCQKLRKIISEDTIAILPSAASVAPLRTESGINLDIVRMRTLGISCIAGLGGLPQVSLPFMNDAGLPCGISLIGPVGSDLALIRLATRLWKHLDEKTH